MNQSLAAFFVFLNVGVCIGLPCPTSDTSNLRFSVFSFHNNTGHRISKMHLAHDADSKDEGPIEFTVDQETKKFNESERMLIDVTAVVSPILNEKSGLTQVKRKVTEFSLPGYKLLEGLGYYKIYAASTDGTWQKASKICEDDGGHFLVLDSKEEVEGILSLISKSSKPNYWHWIGFHDLYSEGHYVTIFNKTLMDTGYVKWGSGEPVEGKVHSCGVLNRDGNLGLHICTSIGTPFICEHELPS